MKASACSTCKNLWKLFRVEILRIFVPIFTEKVAWSGFVVDGAM